MKNIKKFLVALSVFAVVPAFASAEVVVKDTISPEFIHNQGYSDEVSRIIKVKTVDPATPIPVEEASDKMKNFAWYIRKTIDPAVARPNDFVNHNTRYQNSIDDL